MKNINKKVLIFIVAYNAEKTISNVISRIPLDLQKNYKTEILIIDDASNDQTYQVGVKHIKKIKNNFKFTILKNPINQGYGGNQKIGYDYAIKKNFDFVALLHGDGQYAPEYLTKLIAPLNLGKANAVFGSRMIKNTDAIKGGMPIYKFIGNKILTFLQNKLLNTKLSEFHSGYRVYEVNFLKKIPFYLNTNDFHFDTEIIIQILFFKGKIKEIAIPTYYGEEICHVNGIKYAFNVITTSIIAKMQKYNLLYDRRFDVLEDDNSHYTSKLKWESPHSLAFKASRKSKKILDMGCAGGELIEKLSLSNKKISAVDKFKPINLKSNIKFYKFDLNMNLERGDFYNNSYDTILMLDVIEHLNSPEKFLDEIYLMLKKNPETNIFVSTGNISFIATRLLHLFGIFNYGKKGILDLTHTRLFTFKTLQKLFKQSGFIVNEVKGISAPWPLLFGENFFSKTLLFINQFLNKVFPGLFAYQIWMSVKPSPSLDYLLNEAIKNK